LNEVEVYKDLLTQIDQEADKRTYKEYETMMREAQMEITNLESRYETLQAEYNTLVRNEERLVQLADEDSLQDELNTNTTNAETIMSNAQMEFNELDGDINSLMDRLATTTVEDVKDEINEKIEELEGQRDDA
jgi:hypothetical protein